MIVQTLYQRAILFAARKHKDSGNVITGTDLPYLVHVCNVAMEIFIAASQTTDFNLGFAIQVALLHDTLEDTSTTFEELQELFGIDVAQGVLALSKSDSFRPKEDQMMDCLLRIKNQSKEVWAVKLADRITNLQPPPVKWDALKRLNICRKPG